MLQSPNSTGTVRAAGCLSHWRLSDYALGPLLVLAVLMAWEGLMMTNRAETGGWGGDFIQFYCAGTIVARGEADRLYDYPYFRHFQQSVRHDPQNSLYPPTMGLLMAPLARLSYGRAMAAWWALQAACILATGVIFYRTIPLSRAWRINILVALTAIAPLWIAVGIGHLAPMLLLVLAGGLTLHKQGRRGWAGVAISLLALKPQLAAGFALWMFLRRDFRTLLGLAAGFALQVLAVAMLLGPGRWLDYLHAMPAISASIRHYRYSPLLEQSFPGIVRNVLWEAGLKTWQVPAMRIAYAVTASAAAVMLCRVVWGRRPLAGGQTRKTEFIPFEDRGSKNGMNSVLQNAQATENYEYACGVLFMMIFPPYFLVYDQLLLAVPLVMLWSSPAWRWGAALFAAITVVAANVTVTWGISITGLVVLAAMFACLKAACTQVPLAVQSSG